ncbi:facilitated trehalose transporter Tret1-like [Maniola jurtina]|uniref:facilitated trehalose transporter Tret1-like n=1 Tax=Maniola jurtina TaxID=191418 RepID=UPI001E686020|nr:facilitated trehalose transporter Tret1-like [Maniola jurtina]
MLAGEQKNPPDPGFWTETSLIQLGYGIWVNSGMIIIGFAFGFLAVAIPQLRSPDSQIKVTVSDESWIASVVTLVSPIGCVLGGYLIDKFGRRCMLIYGQLPVCLGWFYTGFARSANDIMIGGITTGIGMGIIMSVPRVYLMEISLPNMRGVLGSFANIAISIGITAQAGLGSIFKWSTLCYINSAFSLTLFVLNFGLPETPYYLLKTSVERAKASLKRIRSKKYNIAAEMDKLIEFKRENDIHKLSFKEQLLILFKKSTCKAFWLIVTYMFIMQCSGVTVVAMWTVEMLKNSKSSVDAHVGNVILGFTRVVGGICTSVLMFKLRRRVMALSSGLGVGTACILLCFLIKEAKQPTVVPLILYVVYILSATLGHYTLPVLMMNELYPLQVRGLLGGISSSSLNVIISGANWAYPHSRDSIGFANTILCFGVCSLAGCVFLYIFLPETKGLTLQQTEAYYKSKH